MINMFNDVKEDLIKEKNDFVKLLLVDGTFTSIVFKRSFNAYILTGKLDFIELIFGAGGIAIFCALVGLYSTAKTKLSVIDQLSKIESLVTKIKNEKVDDKLNSIKENN